jgi:hypothetical protein
MNYFGVCSAKDKYHCSIRVCLFYWYCHCQFTSSRTVLWWCLYFRISSVWNLIKVVIFKFVLTAKLDSRFLAGCIQGVFCILCMLCEWKMCVCVLYECIWWYVMLLIVSNETDCCSARVSLSDNAILNMNTVESQLSNLWLSNVPF